MRRLLFRIFGFGAERNPSLLSRKEGLILDLLGEGEMFGLDLIKASRGVLKNGTIYIVLSRMEDKGLVAARMINTVVTTKHEWLGEIHDHEHVSGRRLYRRGVPRARALKTSGKVRREKVRLLSGGD